MAEGIFKKMVSGIDISSAGFSVCSGERASDNAVIVCRKHGIDLSDFKTTNVADVDFEDVDLVLTATMSGRDRIKKIYPNVNAYTIREYGGENEYLDIKDPSDGGLGDYVTCYFEIREALEKILKSHEEFAEGVNRDC
jgi:protein-tyrosine-phosphatase